jgi:two-component system, chemotaxis family, protein-glutamate methylesterase/glutaminase
MVVDDSVVIRGLISRWIAAEPDMVVAASLRTGLDAVNQVERVNSDVAVLDIEMPDLDGISALPQLLAKKRNLIIIMASTLPAATPRSASRRFRSGQPTTFRSPKALANRPPPKPFTTI